MRPTLIAPPALEPVSLVEAKSWLRIDTSDEDALVSALIVAARLSLEAMTRRLFVSQGWRLSFDGWLRRLDATMTMELPFAPFTAVTALRIYGADGAASPVDPAIWRAPPAMDAPRIVFSQMPPQPGRVLDSVEIEATFGYGPQASDTPEPLRRAIVATIARLYENRGDADVPPAAMALAAPFRRERLR